MLKGRYWMVVGAALAAAGVMLGAYHAHGLQSWLESSGAAPEQVARRLGDAEVAVRYQMYHALGLLLLGSWLDRRPGRVLGAACALQTLGVTLFSGGLYLIVFAGTAIHWSIVPLGGVILIVSWTLAAVAFSFKSPDAL